MSKSYLTNRQIMESVQEKFGGDIDWIRQDKTRTGEWKLQQMAATYQRMAVHRDDLIEKRDRAKRDDRISLEQRLFGTGSLVSDSSSIISRRDAGDRLAKVDQQSEASALLERANRTGDEPLARAVAERAFEMRWVDVTNQFLETRPHLDESMNELWDSHAPTLAEELTEGFVLEAGRPTELTGLSPMEVERLAREAEAGAAASA